MEIIDELTYELKFFVDMIVTAVFDCIDDTLVLILMLYVGAFILAQATRLEATSEEAVFHGRQ